MSELEYTSHHTTGHGTVYTVSLPDGTPIGRLGHQKGASHRGDWVSYATPDLNGDPYDNTSARGVRTFKTTEESGAWLLGIHDARMPWLRSVLDEQDKNEESAIERALNRQIFPK